jgi:branched-chain amino acid transport system ATP-binding protein
MLDITGISKNFGGLKALSNVDITVGEGEIVSLIGPNGAGKTTLFAVVSGFLKPDAGDITFDGQTIAGRRPHDICRLGIVRTFQIVKPFANLTVRENIAVGAHTRIAPRAEALTAADKVAVKLGMGQMRDQPARALTIAGRKRLELARALATRPKLLLLDEVMAGLNATEIGEIVEIIQDIRRSGVTIFVIEHVMQAVMKLSDRAYVLNNGALIAEGGPKDIVRNHQVIEAYLGHGAAGKLAGEGAHA